MTNRHQRRRGAALNRKRHNSFFRDYIRHLPEISVAAPPQPGRVHHLVFFHDDDCGFYGTNNVADCTCNPIIRRYVEPVRS
jgi:hypothetical protein